MHRFPKVLVNRCQSFLLLAFLLAPNQLRLVQAAPGWQIVSQLPGVMGLVTVTEEVGGRSGYLNRALQVNGTFRMGGQFSLGEKRMGHIPLLLAPDARQALFLGVGTGATLGAASHHELERLDAVELIPQVLQVMDDFEHVNGGIVRDIGLDLRAADARRFVAASDHRYDIIIADLFHPAKDGAGSLYTLDNFRSVRESLQPGGVFAQWLPLYQLDKRNLQTILRTFLEVFPDSHSFLGLYNTDTPPLLLLGRVPGGETAGVEVDLQQLERAMATPALRSALLHDPHELLAGYMLDANAMRGFAGPGPLNTDLNPRVLFDAPRTVYNRLSDLTWGNLARLLPLRSALPPGLVPQASAQDLKSIAAYREAIGHYLAGELARARDNYPRPLDMNYLQHYLAAYAAQPDFVPAQAYLKLVASVQPDDAARILDSMLRVTPEDPDLQRRRRAIK